MEKTTNYVKRTQKDYSLHFKIQLIKEIEMGEISILEARKKYGIQGDSTVRKWLVKYGNFDFEGGRSASATPAHSPLQNYLAGEKKKV